MPKSERRSMTWRTFQEGCTFRYRIVRPMTPWLHCNWACDGVECRCTKKDCPRWRRLPVVQEQENPDAAI